MTKHIALIITAFCILHTNSAQALDNSPLQIFEEVQTYFEDNADKIGFKDKRLSFDMDGNEKDGLFQLYVSPSTGRDDEDNFSPERLNNIEPAAGVKFTISLD